MHWFSSVWSWDSHALNPPPTSPRPWTEPSIWSANVCLVILALGSVTCECFEGKGHIFSFWYPQYALAWKHIVDEDSGCTETNYKFFLASKPALQLQVFFRSWEPSVSGSDAHFMKTACLQGSCFKMKPEIYFPSKHRMLSHTHKKIEFWLNSSSK